MNPELWASLFPNGPATPTPAPAPSADPYAEFERQVNEHIIRHGGAPDPAARDATRTPAHIPSVDWRTVGPAKSPGVTPWVAPVGTPQEHINNVLPAGVLRNVWSDVGNIPFVGKPLLNTVQQLDLLKAGHPEGSWGKLGVSAADLALSVGLPEEEGVAKLALAAEPEVAAAMKLGTVGTQELRGKAALEASAGLTDHVLTPEQFMAKARARAAKAPEMARMPHEAGAPGQWGTFTWENPNGRPATPEANTAAMERLYQRLDQEGLDYQKTRSKYTDPTTGELLAENGVHVSGHGVTPEKVVELAKAGDQQGAISHAGYHDVPGQTVAPLLGTETVGTDAPIYSQLVEHPDQPAFVAKFDWEKQQPFGTVAPLSPEAEAERYHAAMRQLDQFMAPADAVRERASASFTPEQRARKALAEARGNAVPPLLAQSDSRIVAPTTAGKGRQTSGLGIGRVQPAPSYGGENVLTPGMLQHYKPEDVLERVKNAYRTLDKSAPGPSDEYHGIIDPVWKRDQGPTNAPLPTRAPFGEKQSTGHLDFLQSPITRDLLRAQAERGVKMGGAEWYPSGDAVMKSIDAHGGDSRLWNAATASSSASNSVANELHAGTGIIYALKNGVANEGEMRAALRLPTAERRAYFTKTAKDIQDAAQAHLPGANRLSLMPSHVESFAKSLEGVVPDTYKIQTYEPQRRGDVPGFTLDTHEGRGATLASPFHNRWDKGFAPQGEYGAVEQLYRSVAQELGLSDRGMQASRWTGGHELTGVKTTPNKNFMQIVEGQVMRDARLRGVDPKKLWEQIVQGQSLLGNWPVAMK